MNNENQKTNILSDEIYEIKYVDNNNKSEDEYNFLYANVNFSMIDLLSTFLRKGFEPYYIESNHAWVMHMEETYDNPRFKDLIRIINDSNDQIDDTTEKVYFSINTEYTVIDTNNGNHYDSLYISNHDIDTMDSYEDELVNKLIEYRKQKRPATYDTIRKETIDIYPFSYTKSNDQKNEYHATNLIQNKFIENLEKYFEDSDRYAVISIGPLNE